MERALSDAGIKLEDAARDGFITVVIVRSTDWSDVARHAWAEWARPGSHPCERETRSYRSDKVWTSFSPEELPRPSGLKEQANVLARAVAKGLHVGGFSPDPAWLSEDLIRAADYRITLPLLSAEDIRRVAVILCGDHPTEMLTDEEATSVTPRELRLARRLGQSAGQYLGKLKRLLQAVPATPSAAASADIPIAPTLDRLHGMDEAVAWGMALARDLEAYKLGELPWSRVDRGCLLSGPPGTGKTIFTKSLAATCKVPLVAATYSQWQGSGAGYLGDHLKAMSKTFKEAREAAPCVLFIDEVDSFPDREKLFDHNRDYTVQTVNALLAEIDGVNRLEGVVLVGACNYPDRLDPALIRSGRLDRHIRIRRPDRAAIAAIMREHLGDDLHGADLTHAATAAAGATGADCEQIVRGARRRARTASRPMVMADLMTEIEGDAPVIPRDLWIAAIHEAGHAVAAAVQHPGCLAEICLASRGDAGGHTQGNYNRSRYPSANDLRKLIVMTLAGRASEEELAGTPTSGAGGGPGSDLSIATSLAVDIYTNLGLDKSGGLLWRGVHETAAVPKALAADPAMADRITAYLDDAYGAALELVRTNRSAVLAIAKVLLDKRVMSGAAVEEIVRRQADEIRTSGHLDWEYPWRGTKTPVPEN
jgi:ATP-dependent Zn protease